MKRSQEAIQRSTPHIYLSALALCWRESPIRKRFESEYGGIPLVYWGKTQSSREWLFRIGRPTVSEDVFDDSEGQIMSPRDKQAVAPEANPLETHT